MAISNERRAEIGLELLRAWLLEDGFRVGGNMNRELGNLSKKTGIPMEELLDFMEVEIQVLMERVISKARKQKVE